LYGKNATGGAVSVVSNAPPTPRRLFNVGYGRWQTLDVSGAISGPLGKNFAAALQLPPRNKARGGNKTSIPAAGMGRHANSRLARSLSSSPTMSSIQCCLCISAATCRLLLVSGRQCRCAGLPELRDGMDTGTTSATAVKVERWLFIGISRRRGVVDDAPVLGFADLISIVGFDELDFRNSDNNNGIPAPIYDLYQHDFVRQAYEETRLVSAQPLLNVTDWILGTSYSWQKFHGQDASDQSTLFVGLYETPPDLTTRGLSVAQADYIQNPNRSPVPQHDNSSVGIAAPHPGRTLFARPHQRRWCDDRDRLR